jgi:hypothetical protein
MNLDHGPILKGKKMIYFHSKAECIVLNEKEHIVTEIGNKIYLVPLEAIEDALQAYEIDRSSYEMAVIESKIAQLEKEKAWLVQHMLKMPERSAGVK